MIQIIMQKMDSFCVSLNVYVGRRRFRRPILRRNYPKNVGVRLDEPRKKRRKRNLNPTIFDSFGSSRSTLYL